MLVIPTHLSKRAKKRNYVPLDLELPADVAPSHAVSPGWTTCHPITQDRPIDDQLEYPAVTHFATCPNRARDRASTAPEGRTA